MRIGSEPNPSIGAPVVEVQNRTITERTGGLWRRMMCCTSEPQETLQESILREITTLEREIADLNEKIRKVEQFIDSRPQLLAKCSQAWESYRSETVVVKKTVGNYRTLADKSSNLQRERLELDTKLNNYKRFVRDHPAIAAEVRQELGMSQILLLNNGR